MQAEATRYMEGSVRAGCNKDDGQMGCREKEDVIQQEKTWQTQRVVGMTNWEEGVQREREC